ncbi:MAG: class I SAM-dependent methyltransferase [Patescibacteria group bacterium]
MLAIFLSTYQIYTNILQPGAIYYPTPNSAVTQILKLSRAGSQDTLIDLGSGDGRILLAAARLGTVAIGYEINPFLVWRSRRRIYQAKLDKLATVRWKSFWQADFSQATIVTVYLLPHLMNRLQRLLKKEVNHPIRLVTNDYPFRELTPAKHYRQIYLYYFKAGLH